MRCLLVVVFVAILLAAADLIRADSPAEAAGAEGVRDGRFHEIGIGARTGDYSDSKTTMYTTDSGAPAEQRSE